MPSVRGEPPIGGPHGYDGGKRLKGRKQHIVVDMLGLLLAVTVTSAAADDGAAAPQVPKKAADFGVRQAAWMPLAVEQDEPRRPVHDRPGWSPRNARAPL